MATNIDMSRVVYHECIMTGARHIAVDNEVEDADADPTTPPMWAQVTITRVIPNPDASAVAAERAAWVETQAGVIPPEQRNTPEGQYAIQALQQQAIEQIPDEAPFEVQMVTFALSPDHVDKLAICDELRDVLDINPPQIAPAPAPAAAPAAEEAPSNG